MRITVFEYHGLAMFLSRMTTPTLVLLRILDLRSINWCHPDAIDECQSRFHYEWKYFIGYTITKHDTTIQLTTSTYFIQFFPKKDEDRLRANKVLPWHFTLLTCKTHLRVMKLNPSYWYAFRIEWSKIHILKIWMRIHGSKRSNFSTHQDNGSSQMK